MRWKDARKSSNVEDRRSRGNARRHVKIGGGALLIIVIVSYLLGENPLQILGLLEATPPAQSADDGNSVRTNDENAEFVSVVLGDMEDIWYAIFSQRGMTYEPAKLVLFRGSVESACGFNTAASGPFYCPPDRRVYIDLDFMAQLQRMGATGDFALAYVIGHEVGHHVQNLLGTSDAVRRQQNNASRYEANRLSVALELQADCYAGVWANRSRKRGTIRYDADDFREGLRTASVIGDDQLQRQAGRRVQPETFTHGSSAQRTQWLTEGLQSGNLERCDTFQ